MEENDILIENTDVAVLNGDFDIQDCNNQNLKHLIIAVPSNYVISPKVGASVYTFQNMPVTDPRELFAKISNELKNDGYKTPVFGGSSDLESTDLEVSAIRIKTPIRNII